MMTAPVTKPALEHPYYNFDKVLSFNAVLNIVSGARGLGKTYGAKRLCIAKALKSYERGETIQMFVYLRRYKEEVQDSKATFFADIADEFPGYDFRVQGHLGQFAPMETRDEKKRQWLDMATFVALSTSQSKKGVSYHTTTSIIFDEFILEKGNVQYIRNETNTFLNFYSTVDRNKDKTRVFMLSNAVSIDNPYFIKWNIKPDEVKEFTRYGIAKDGRSFVVAHFPDSEDFQKSVYATRFGQFIEGSEFAQTAVGNVFKDNNSRLVMVKDHTFRLQFAVETNDGTFSVWYSDFERQYFAQSKVPPNTKLFTIEPELMEAGKTLLVSSDPLMGMLRTAFRKDALYFDSPRTRNALMNVFR